MSDNFYSQKEWHKLRSKMKAKWKRENLPCAYCKKPLDWTQRPIVDHILNRKQHPERALDESNLQVVHHQCNSKKYAYEENTSKTPVNLNGFPEGSDWS